MPHANGHIYSDTVNGVKVGINTDDVATVIGVGSHDVATLCYSKDNINKWARNKPEAIGGPADITDAQRKANNFALRMPTTFTTIQNYVNAALGVNGIKLTGWTYAAPGAGDWARLTDFDGYRANAESPFPTLMQGDYVVAQSSDGVKRLNIALAAGYEGTPGNTDYIRLADLNKADAKYSDWYAGVLIVTNTSPFYLATSDAAVSSSSLVQFNTNNAVLIPAEGKHKAWVFLANKTFRVCSQGSIAMSGLQLIPLTTEPVDIEVISTSSLLTVTCGMQSQKIAVTVTNKNAVAVTITPVQIQYSATGSDSDAVSQSTIESLTAFDVAAGSAANPTVLTKTYTAPIVGKAGYIRLVYKFKPANGTTSVNQTTKWTVLISSPGLG